MKEHFYVVTRERNDVEVTIDDRPATTSQLEQETVQVVVRHLRSLNPRVTHARMSWWEVTSD